MTNICCCGAAEEIYKGSTPSLYFTTNAPLKNIQAMFITFKQCDHIIVEKHKTDIIIEEDGSFRVDFTQEETLLFSSKYEIAAQLRIKYEDGSALTSAINTFTIQEVLKHEVI